MVALFTDKSRPVIVKLKSTLLINKLKKLSLRPVLPPGS